MRRPAMRRPAMRRTADRAVDGCRPSPERVSPARPPRASSVRCAGHPWPWDVGGGPAVTAPVVVPGCRNASPGVGPDGGRGCESCGEPGLILSPHRLVAELPPPCPLAPALADRIRGAREELTRRWLDRISARVALDPNRIFPTDNLLDHMPILLDGIAAYIEDPAQEVPADAPVVAKAMELGALR